MGKGQKILGRELGFEVKSKWRWVVHLREETALARKPEPEKCELEERARYRWVGG